MRSLVSRPAICHPINLFIIINQTRYVYRLILSFTVRMCLITDFLTETMILTLKRSPRRLSVSENHKSRSGYAGATTAISVLLAFYQTLFNSIHLTWTVEKENLVNVS